MLKRWCSIKEIEVYLLCEIWTSKDTLQRQKKTVASLLKCDNVTEINFPGVLSDTFLWGSLFSFRFQGYLKFFIQF